MKIYYKGICNLSSYCVMGEDRPALYSVTLPNNEIFNKEFNKIHYSLWAKILFTF